MDECASSLKNEKVLTVYLKAIPFFLPSLVAFAFAAVFILPKVNQMCAEVGYDARAILGPIELLIASPWMFLIGCISLLIVLETWVPLWRNHRAAFVGTLVVLLNSAILIELLCTLIIATVVGPQMRGK